MFKTAQQTSTAVMKLFDAFCVWLYVLALACVVSFFWFQQAQQSSMILHDKSAITHFSDLIEVRSLDSSQLLYSVNKGNYPLVRIIQEESTDRVIMFIHPLWIVLMSPYFLISSVIFVIIVIRTRVLLYRSIDGALTQVTAIENWANLSSIRGEIQPLPKQGVVTETISSIMNQLSEVKHRYGRADLRIREQALLDSETGVGNREFFTNRLEAILCEEDARGAVFFINFQGLEIVQSLYGYAHALNILESSINLINGKLEQTNNFFMARRGEFELALLVPGLYVNETEKLANKLLKVLEKVDFPVGINQEEGIHIGISYFKQNQQCYQIMAEADMALRSAQLQGPSQWFMYETGEVENESAKGSLKWRTFLTKAINNNAFVLFFQPVLASQSDHILHHEILSKVRDGRGKLISARVFLPMAQKCGLAAKIDMLVFEQTCRLLQYEEKQHDICSINISIDALLSEDFIERLFNKLAMSPAIASKLIVEVSEYHLVTNLTKLEPVLVFLDELGIKILADKVGQYVMSADYIRSCPISYLKLHRSIVHLIHERLANQVFVQSLNTLCLECQVEIYALGVENVEEWTTLTRLGVVGGQGHFFTEPVAQMAQAIEWH